MSARWVAAAAVGVTLTGAACGSHATSAASTAGKQPAAVSASASAAGSPAPAATVALRSVAPVGPVLTDAAGLTLYVLMSPAGATLPCSAACQAIWPAVSATGALRSGSGVSATLSATGGQLVVDGRPVHTFRGDSAPGSAAGEGIRSFGGVWYALSASGSVVKPAKASSSTSGGYGYGYG